MLADSSWKFDPILTYPTLLYYTSLELAVIQYSVDHPLGQRERHPCGVIKWQIILSLLGFYSEYTSQMLSFRSPTLNT